MAFNSPLFMLFVAACAVVHAVLPRGRQNLFLLLASFACYVWAAPQYGALLLGTVALVYFGARWVGGIENAGDVETRKGRLAVTIALPLVVLGVFKYFNFFMGAIATLFGAVGLTFAPPELGWLLPVGISFYTFQAIGYCVDVYRGDVRPETNFIDFALFLSFFPQVMSGPIGRANELLPQIKDYRPFVYSETLYGLRRFLLGLFKKTVVADGLGLLVNAVYADLRDYSGLTLLLVILAYGVQIYFDFAGYSDMAVGIARLFGISLRENFFAPYFATNITEFWRRWHVSLTSWLRDYIYIPLGGNRRGFARKLFNVAAIFLISGLWHGAAWTFVAWGALHALVRVIEELVRQAKAPNPPKQTSRAANAVRAALVFLFASAAFVLFRAPGLADAAYVWRGVFTPGDAVAQLAAVWDNASPGITLGATYTVLFFGLLAMSLVLAVVLDYKLAQSVVRGKAPLLEPLGAVKSKAARWLLYWFMAFCSMLFLFIVATASRGTSFFIYFGF